MVFMLAAIRSIGLKQFIRTGEEVVAGVIVVGVAADVAKSQAKKLLRV